MAKIRPAEPRLRKDRTKPWKVLQTTQQSRTSLLFRKRGDKSGKDEMVVAIGIEPMTLSL